MSGLKLKLNLNTAGLNRAPSLGTPTPLVTPGGSKPKLKLTNHSNPPTPAPAPAPVEDVKPKKTKTGRTTKPSAKILESRKRIKEESDSEEEEGSTIQVQPPSKKLKLNFGPKTPVVQTPIVLKAKVRGKPPKRPLGEGYDSEASDREIDPMIEEEFVLRMFPGEDCEYLRTMINQKKIGLPLLEGGADVRMRFYHGDGRRAAITIRGRHYAASLVDLPCVVEGMKSWDKRGWWKSADICQMLWVFASVKKEEEAKTIALPKIIDPETFQYPHGLTPPMHYARKRRFRKRISRTAIEAVEDAVEKLLKADQGTLSTRWEIIDPDAGSRQTSQAYSPGASSPEGYEVGQDEYSADEDAEGEVDDAGYFGNGHHTNGVVEDDMDADLEADLEAAMQAESLEAATPLSTLGATPSMANGETPTAVEGEGDEEEEDSGDESLEDDEVDEAGGEIDDDEQARIAQIQGAREDIVDLEKQLANVQGQLAIQSNPILKRRLEDNARKLKAELQLKKSAIGEAEDD